jgi:hypothetical protein
MTTTDQTLISTNARTVVRARRAVLSLLLAAAAVVGLNAQGASAATTSYASGYYGSVTPRGAQGGAISYKEVGALYFQRVPAVTVFGPIVGRSLATTGTQVVEFRYAMFRWTGSQWVTEYNTGAPFVQTIPAGYGSTSFAPVPIRVLTSGYHRVTFSVTWKDAYGRVLGSRGFDNSQASDYSCTLPSNSCVVGNGWVWI